MMILMKINDAVSDSVIQVACLLLQPNENKSFTAPVIPVASLVVIKMALDCGKWEV